MGEYEIQSGNVALQPTQMAASDANGFNMNTNLVDDFEEAFQGIINSFTKEDGLSHTQESKEELKTDAEQNIARFIEVAKQLETFFLQRRLQLSVLKPEQLIKEDCNELKLELARKDELIKKHYEKIAVWQSMLGDVPGTSTNGSTETPSALMQHPPQQQPHPPQQPMIPGGMPQQPFPNR